MTTRTVHMSLPLNRPATGAPVITGPATVGQVLAVDVTGIEDEDGLHDVEYTYQWVRVDADGTSNEEDITDATDATYTLTDDDLGKKVKIEVSFADDFGSDEQRTSAPTETVAGAPNTPATGAPTITGTAQVGETLTAVTTGIMDADGLTSVSYSYQWIRVDADGTSNPADITDETDATYTLVDADLGKKIKVRVTFVDDASHTETLTSAATATVPGVTVSPPALTVTEEDMTGATYTVVLNSQPTATVTVTVAGHAGTDVTPSPTTLTFTPTNWGTAQTVTVTAGDDADTANESVSLTHSAASTDSDYQGITIAGVAVTVTDNDDTNTAATGKPTITGTAQVGETLTAVTTGIMDVDGLTNPEYKYQWIRVNGPEADIADANSSTYTLGAADLGTTLKVRVTFRDDDKSNTETRTSAATETVVAVAMTTPGVTVSKTELTVTEEDPTGDSYTVVLNTQPTATVTVTVAGHAGTDVTPSPTTLTFTPTNWGTAQTVTVTAGNDADLVNETVSLTHSAASTDSDYQGITIAGVAVTVTDNDDTNTAPVFSSSNVSREIAENTAAGQNVGAAVTATDTDTDDTLGYTLGGPGAASFDFVESSGQIRTKTNVSYDFEAKSSYTVTVTASDGTGTAVATVTISVTDVAEPPDAPATPMVNAVSGSTTSLAVSWAAPANAGKPAIASYDVQYRVGSSGAWSDGPVDVTGTSTTIASLVASTDYEARVRATNAEGNSGWSDPPGSGRTNNATTRPPPPPPPPVTGLAQVMGVGVAPGNAQLVVTWTAVDNATGYTVQWMSGGQGYNTGDRQATVTTGSTTRYTIPGLTNGTEYTGRVIATRTGASDGPPSAEVKGTPFTTPGAPQHLSGVPGDEQVMLTWDAPSSDGGSAILRYEYAIDDSGTWIDAGLDLEETVPGLTNGQQYVFEVRAVNSAGPRCVGEDGGHAARYAECARVAHGHWGRRRGRPGVDRARGRWRRARHRLRVPLCGGHRGTWGHAVAIRRAGPRVDGHRTDQWPAVRLRGAGGEQRRPRCAGEDGGHAARHAECARVAHGHWGRRRGRPGVECARGRWRLACDGLRVPLRRRPGCAGRRHLAGRGHRAHGDGHGAGERDALRVRGAGAEPCGPRGDIGDDGPAASVAGGAVQLGCARDGRRGARGWGAPEREARVSGPRLHRRDGQRVAWRDGNGRGARRRARPPASGVRGGRSRVDSDGHGGLRRRAPAGPGAHGDARFRGTGGRRRKAAL